MKEEVEFVFKYPTRARPHLFKQTLKKYQTLLSGSHSYHFIITLDKDDRTMNNDDMLSFLSLQPNLEYHIGTHKNKVEAINDNFPPKNLKWKILVLLSDDMIPVKVNYDSFIYNAMNRYFPNYDGALHFSDGKVKKKIITLSIMGNKLFDQLGYIYHPDYVSLWCDNEFTDITKNMGKYQYIDRVIIKHYWVDYTGRDSLHKRNESYLNHDKKTYLKRKAAGFPKKSVL